MPLPEPLPESDDDRSLVDHVDALYALAQVLDGTDETSSLVRTVYEHAAEVPPAQRPPDERAWLFRLLAEARDEDLQSVDAEAASDSDTSFTDDPLRREVARETAERRLPVAFAACSVHERFILAIDALGEPSDDLLDTVLPPSTTDARSVRDQARSALRASLRDVLRGPERMLVDVALPDQVLREHLRDLLLDRFHSPPASLKATVTEVLAQARAERRDDSAPTGSAPSAGTTSLRAGWNRTVEAVWDGLSLRGLIGGLVFLVIVTAGIGGASYFFSPSAPSAPPSVVDLSAEQANRVEMALQTSTPSRASAYVRQSFDRRISVPAIDGASLQGVGRLSLSMGTDVPTLLYADAETGAEIVAFVFNYALLNGLEGRATLSRDRRTELADNKAPLATQRGEHAVVLWRQRDDIFVVVALDQEAAPLRSRVQP